MARNSPVAASLLIAVGLLIGGCAGMQFDLCDCDHGADSTESSESKPVKKEKSFASWFHLADPSITVTTKDDEEKEK